MVFCNKEQENINPCSDSHNPYFNRWFSAIWEQIPSLYKQEECHNPYFNRWFSAILMVGIGLIKNGSHNPYFNRWFSAI